MIAHVNMRHTDGEVDCVKVGSLCISHVPALCNDRPSGLQRYVSLDSSRSAVCGADLPHQLLEHSIVNCKEHQQQAELVH